MTKKNLTAEPINEALKDHALTSGDWRYREAVGILHEWAARFNEELRLGLQTPVIGLNRIPVRRLGTYRPGRNGLGLRHEIVLNTAHLDRPLCQQLATLLHELIHEWQGLFGKPGSGNYHNHEFRIKAKQYGLIVDQFGHGQGVEPGAFTKLLTKYGVDMEMLPITEDMPIFAARPRGDSNLKKWRCGCTNVRCAVELTAQCLKCGLVFEEAPPAW